MKPPITLFPPAPQLTLVANQKLKDAVDVAVEGVVTVTPDKPAAPFAITIIDPVSGAVGGFNEEQEHYAASIVKVCVMYAAHALLDMVKRYNSLRKPAAPKALFNGLRTEMDGAIERSSRIVLGGTGNSTYRVPSYESVFATTTKLDKTLDIQFHQSYLTAMKEMIVNSSEPGSATCIHGLGYSYLNGLLENHGIFKAGVKPVDHKGVWVGGDFMGWGQVRILCVNDGDTAAGSTSRAIAHLMAVILLDTVVPNNSHPQMINLLELAAHGPDSSWMSRTQVSIRFAERQVTHAKIGVGPLKSKKKVYSEVCALKDVGSKRYVVGFVNINNSPYGLDDIFTVIKEAVRIYEAPP